MQGTADAPRMPLPDPDPPARYTVSMSGKRRAGLTIVKLGFLFSLLTGCLTKSPSGPGTSTPLVYPVVLFQDRDFHLRMDEERLTTTTIASGLNYLELHILDSSGARYSIRKVTNLDNHSGFFNMGTASDRVFLHLKSEGKLTLDQAKSTIKAVAARHPQVQNTKAADQEIGGAKNFRELVEMCGHPWDWR